MDHRTLPQKCLAVLCALGALSSFILWPFPAPALTLAPDAGQEAAEPDTKPATAGAPLPQAPDIRGEIARAQAFLLDKSAGYGKEVCRARISFKDRRGRKRSRIRYVTRVTPNFLLAVENLQEGRLYPVLFTEKGCATDGFQVVLERNNGVGSRFRVVYPENMTVLAIRTLVHGRGSGYKEVVYTPYSPEIDTPEMREAGYDYLLSRIELAKADLEKRRVRLPALGRLSRSGLLSDLTLVLCIIEHIDPERFKNCPEGQESELVHEVLAVIGANTSNAYAYSKSPAGARGLFQFMPATYEKLRRRYRVASLDSDFILGSTDHVNAAKASLLLFDSDLSGLPRKLLSNAGQDLRVIGRYLAAAYNCGPRRVKKSARACSEGWTCRLPEETRTYLRKFDLVWELRKDLYR